MGDKIKPHPSDCATCAPGSPALLHAASNAAAERAAAERERVAFLRAKCADLGEALASAIDERDEAKADLDALARAVAQALMVPTLRTSEELVDPSDHAIVGAMLGMRNARDTALEALAVRANREATIEDLSEALASAIDERGVLSVLVECQDELQAARARLAEVERERDAARADLYETREGLRKLQKERDEADAALAREKVLHKWAVDEERDEARAKLSEVQRELAEARAAARAAVYEARVGWRVSERLRGQAEGEVARLRFVSSAEVRRAFCCFAEGLAQGLSVPAAGASSGLCRVCLTARPPLAEVATVTTRGASGEILHFCDECWGLTAARHSGVAR